MRGIVVEIISSVPVSLYTFAGYVFNRNFNKVQHQAINAVVWCPALRIISKRCFHTQNENRLSSIAILVNPSPSKSHVFFDFSYQHITYHSLVDAFIRECNLQRNGCEMTMNHALYFLLSADE